MLSTVPGFESESYDAVDQQTKNPGSYPRTVKSDFSALNTLIRLSEILYLKFERIFFYFSFLAI